MGNLGLISALGSLVGIPRMTINRIIASEPYMIDIGVTDEMKREGNPMSAQVIRINDGSLKPLISFVETENALIYDFEDNITLKLMKRDNHEILYYIKTPEFENTSIMHDIIRKHWKPISLKSEEFDKIGSFIKMDS